MGGGPAGASAAAVMAAHGAEVLLIEREAFPRHHVGESVQPAAFRLLDLHLGIGEAIAEAGYQRKYGAIYRWGVDDNLWSVLFDRRLTEQLPELGDADLHRGDFEHAWHVDRAHFDALLLGRAQEAGVEVLRARVRGPVERDGRVVGVVVDGPSGVEEIEADWVFDATGQGALLARHFGLLVQHEDLRSVAAYAYVRGACRLPSALNREATYVVSVPDGWAWWIPLGPDRTSIGLVTSSTADLPRGDGAWARLVEVAEQAGLPLPAGASEADPQVRTTRDWSYGVTARCGPGWTVLGDAGGFVDPILAGGVDFAIRDACNAAIAWLEAREAATDAALQERMMAHASQAATEFRAYLKLARYWYGNNRSVEGLFWEARRAIPEEVDFVDTPLRAFAYLTSGEYSADRHFKVFIAWQERRIFQQLGVDKQALGRAVKALRRRR